MGEFLKVAPGKFQSTSPEGKVATIEEIDKPRHCSFCDEDKTGLLLSSEDRPDLFICVECLRAHLDKPLDPEP